MTLAEAIKLVELRLVMEPAVYHRARTTMWGPAPTDEQKASMDIGERHYESMRPEIRKVLLAEVRRAIREGRLEATDRDMKVLFGRHPTYIHHRTWSGDYSDKKLMQMAKAMK